MTNHVSTRRIHDIASPESAAAPWTFPRRPRLTAGVVARLAASLGAAQLVSASDDYPVRTGASRGSLLAASIARSQSIGIALLVRDRIVTRNERFAELARTSLAGGSASASGRWTVSSSQPDSRVERIRVAGLEALVTLLSARVARGGAHAHADLRVAHDGDDRVWRLRLEGGGSAKVRTGPTLAIIDDAGPIARLEGELARAREGLRRRETLLSMGEIAAGVAHDLGNTLGALQIRTELVGREPDLTAVQREHLAWVKNGLRDSLAMLARVQESLRSGMERPTHPIDICAVVRHVVEFAGTSFTERLGKRIDISVQLPTLPQVWGVAADLRQMFMNLLLNARDAMPRGGTIRIRGYADRNRVVIKVEDEGTGVPAAIRERIFDPFFTTKGENGTGIGLALARDLMTRIGGRISVTNRSHGGAIFTLRFLVAEPSTSRALPPSHAADPADLSA